MYFFYFVHHAECTTFPFVLDTTRYSFSTRLHENTETSDGPIIFGTVDLGTGGGYDEFTGNSY